jgi:hypothetical protein
MGHCKGKKDKMTCPKGHQVLTQDIIGKRNDATTNHFRMGVLKGENTLHPPKIVVTKTKILHLIFFCKCGHHILDYFYSFLIYCINFRLKLAYLKRNSNKHLQT